MVFGRLDFILSLFTGSARSSLQRGRLQLELRTQIPLSILTLVPERKRAQSECGSERRVQKEKEHSTCVKCSFSFCDPAGIRTQDPYIKSVLLYQLSYGIFFFSSPHSFVIAGAKIGIFCVYASSLTKKNEVFFIFSANLLNLSGKIFSFFLLFLCLWCQDWILTRFFQNENTSVKSKRILFWVFRCSYSETPTLKRL